MQALKMPGKYLYVNETINKLVEGHITLKRERILRQNKVTFYQGEYGAALPSSFASFFIVFFLLPIATLPSDPAYHAGIPSGYPSGPCLKALVNPAGTGVLPQIRRAK